MRAGSRLLFALTHLLHGCLLVWLIPFIASLSPQRRRGPARCGSRFTPAPVLNLSFFCLVFARARPSSLDSLRTFFDFSPHLHPSIFGFSLPPAPSWFASQPRLAPLHFQSSLAPVAQSPSHGGSRTLALQPASAPFDFLLPFPLIVFCSTPRNLSSCCGPLSPFLASSSCVLRSPNGPCRHPHSSLCCDARVRFWYAKLALLCISTRALSAIDARILFPTGEATSLWPTVRFSPTSRSLFWASPALPRYPPSRPWFPPQLCCSGPASHAFSGPLRHALRPPLHPVFLACCPSRIPLLARAAFSRVLTLPRHAPGFRSALPLAFFSISAPSRCLCTAALPLVFLRCSGFSFAGAATPTAHFHPFLAPPPLPACQMLALPSPTPSCRLFCSHAIPFSQGISSSAPFLSVAPPGLLLPVRASVSGPAPAHGVSSPCFSPAPRPASMAARLSALLSPFCRSCLACFRIKCASWLCFRFLYKCPLLRLLSRPLFQPRWHTPRYFAA